MNAGDGPSGGNALPGSARVPRSERCVPRTVAHRSVCSSAAVCCMMMVARSTSRSRHRPYARAALRKSASASAKRFGVGAATAMKPRSCMARTASTSRPLRSASRASSSARSSSSALQCATARKYEISARTAECARSRMAVSAIAASRAIPCAGTMRASAAPCSIAAVVRSSTSAMAGRTDASSAATSSGRCSLSRARPRSSHASTGAGSPIRASARRSRTATKSPRTYDSRAAERGSGEAPSAEDLPWRVCVGTLAAKCRSALRTSSPFLGVGATRARRPKRCRRRAGSTTWRPGFRRLRSSARAAHLPRHRPRLPTSRARRQVRPR